MPFRPVKEPEHYSVKEAEGAKAFGNVTSRYRHNDNLRRYTGPYNGKWYQNGTPMNAYEGSRDKEKKPGRRNGSRR